MEHDIEGFLEDARSILGETRVYTEDWARAPGALDFWPLRLWGMIRKTNPPRSPKQHSGNRAHGEPFALLLPQEPEELPPLVEAAARRRVGLRVAGAGSGVMGALSRESPKPYAVVDTGLLRSIGWWEESNIVKVGAGLLWWEVEAWLNKRGYTTGHHPQSRELASVGGLIAAGSSGHYSTGYGSIEDLFLGGRIATGRGLLELPPRLREPHGPPLRRLFVGSEGLLGAVLEAYIQARPLPECTTKNALLAPSGMAQALEGARLLATRPPGATASLLRVWDEYEAGLEGLTRGDWGAVLAYVYEAPCGVAEALDTWATRALRDLGLRPLGGEVVDHWMESRFRVFEKLALLVEQGLWFETMEFSNTWAGLPVTYARVREALLELEGVVSVTAHAGHFYPGGGALYFTLLAGQERYGELYWEAWQRAIDASLSTGGSLSHHHGVGVVRAGALSRELGAHGKAVWEAVKRALDPHNVFV